MHRYGGDDVAGPDREPVEDEEVSSLVSPPPCCSVLTMPLQTAQPVGDPLIKAELELLERLIMGIRGPPPSGIVIACIVTLYIIVL